MKFPDVRDAIIDATVKVCADIAERQPSKIPFYTPIGREAYLRGRKEAAAEIRAEFAEAKEKA